MQYHQLVIGADFSNRQMEIPHTYLRFGDDDTPIA